MDEAQALSAFAALADPTRLRILRLLVQTGPEGLSAGKIGEAVGASSSRASFHFSILERAGLASSRREARSIIYSAGYDSLTNLIAFLMRDCCAGRPEICLPAIGALACCAPALTSSNV
jgi:ArsR family transcriptional regulator